MKARPKRVLLVHVPYSVRGGEDVHVEGLRGIYLSMGIEAILFPENRQPPGLLSPFQAFRSLSNSEDFSDFEDAFERFRPDAVHLHNVYPVLGPRFFHFLAEKKVRTLYTAHNHRFFCTNGLALRGGETCHACLPSPANFWKPFLFNCNGSVAKSAYYAKAISQTRRNGWMHEAVSAYIVPSPHLSDLLGKWGAPAGRVHVVPHAVEVPMNPNAHGIELLPPSQHDVLFLGRLSHEKGVGLLLEASRRLARVRFSFAGEGPMRALVEKEAKETPRVRWLGALSREDALRELPKTRMAAMPSLCDESFGQSAIEAFLSAKACLLPERESLAWMKDGQHSPIWFQSGDAISLADAIQNELRNPTRYKDLFPRSEALRAKYSPSRYAEDLGRIWNTI